MRRRYTAACELTYNLRTCVEGPRQLAGLLRHVVHINMDCSACPVCWQGNCHRLRTPQDVRGSHCECVGLGIIHQDGQQIVCVTIGDEHVVVPVDLQAG